MNEDNRRRYESAAHRMQSATALMTTRALGILPGMQTADIDVETLNRLLKHQRTGLNSAMASHEGLVRLLIDRGVFSLDEYDEAMVGAMEREADARCDDAVETLGLPEGTRFG